MGGGLGSGALAGWVAATVANRWFATQRGVVVGLLTASTATGQLVFLPLLATIIARIGWRSAVLVVAGCAAAMIPLVALVIRNRPQDLGLQPYGATAAEPPAVVATTNPFRMAFQTLRDCLRSRDFLVAGRQLLHLRRQHQRPDRHTSDPGLRTTTASPRSPPPACWR